MVLESTGWQEDSTEMLGPFLIEDLATFLPLIILNRGSAVLRGYLETLSAVA